MKRRDCVNSTARSGRAGSRSFSGICRRGGRYSLKLGAANVFVTEENDESVRSVTAARLAGEGKPLQILHLSDLYSLLELNE